MTPTRTRFPLEPIDRGPPESLWHVSLLPASNPAQIIWFVMRPLYSLLQYSWLTIGTKAARSASFDSYGLWVSPVRQNNHLLDFYHMIFISSNWFCLPQPVIKLHVPSVTTVFASGSAIGFILLQNVTARTSFNKAKSKFDVSRLKFGCETIRSILITEPLLLRNVEPTRTKYSFGSPLKFTNINMKNHRMTRFTVHVTYAIIQCAAVNTQRGPMTEPPQ